ncbi:MAG TPA: hypothetical protein VD710_07415 [Nitrososphaeraceae archaeon]|nr:hypothetical protein [Nitrososphaeraceae archaeon]
MKWLKKKETRADSLFTHVFNCDGLELEGSLIEEKLQSDQF